MNLRERCVFPRGMKIIPLATKVMGATGDLSLVLRALGHTNAQTAMIYQHPSLETVRSVVNDQLGRDVGPMLVRHIPRHTVVMWTGGSAVSN